MPVPNGSTNNHKKQRKWSLAGILSKKKKLKKSQESLDFCPYDGKINQKVAQNNHLERSTDCLIEQYTCSPRLIRRCNSLQYTSQVPVYSKITSQPSLNEWKSSQQSVYSSSSSACYSDIGAYRHCGSSQQSSYYTKEKNDQRSPVLQKVPVRCSSENSHYQNKINYNQKYLKSSVNQTKLIGKKIPPPPPPRDPNIKAVYYFRNNRLMSRESDSTYFSQGSDDNIPDKDEIDKYEKNYRNEYSIKEPPRSRRPIQICDVETLSTESENSMPRTQSVEEALQELEDIYNSLGLSDEDLLDRAERRDLPTIHQNMRYQNFDELDCVSVTRVLPKTRRSGVPDIIADDMAYRRLNKKESKRQSFIPGSFLLVLPTVYNIDKNSKPSKEPDITLDDVVFRSRRQHLNFLRIPDPQPPFGIPLGPIIGATPSDYLHAVPEGRYKPSFHPRKVPDTVEDDLAFRTLRKDNKYKTCIDFSFIHKNRLKIDNLTPNLSSNRIKNDTHWIVKKTNLDRSHNKNQVKFMFDNLVDSIGVNSQNVMVVKINHHKPIMLTGFTFNEANRLSKSFFRTNLSQHESRKICLTNDTYHTPNRTAQLKSQCSLNALIKPKVNALPVVLNHSAINHHLNIAASKTVNCMGKKSSPQVQYTYLDNDGLMCKSIDGPASQPNFRELIKREYAHRYLLTENQSNSDFVPNNRIRVMPATDKRTQGKFEHRLINNDSSNGTMNSTDSIAAKQKSESTYNEDERLSFKPTSISIANAPEKRTGIGKDSSPSMSTGILSTEYPNHMPGYLEVCLYIAVYIYQLLSVNAYSTFIALIFLIALHLCRRLS